MPDELSRCAPGLARSMLPVWVLDADSIQICWANDHALEHWGAETREALYARDIMSSAPPAVAARIDAVIARVAAGESVSEEWIMYPGGTKTTVMAEFSPLTLDGGKLGILVQVRALDRIDEPLERDIAMFRHASVISALVTPTGLVLSQNPAADDCFGTHERWTQWFESADEARELLARTTASGDTQHGLLRVTPERGSMCWHMVGIQVIRDPVTTELGVLVEHVDVTAQVEAESLAENRGQQLAALDATLALVARQREEILALSAPLLDVGRGVLAVPIIGRFDRERSEALGAKLLDRVQQRSISRVIIDLTGLAELDADSGRYLEALVASLALLGAQTRLCGVRPALARELARAGLEIEALGFYRSLAGAIR